jgi:hypothetical protein
MEWIRQRSDRMPEEESARIAEEESDRITT